MDKETILISGTIFMIVLFVFIGVVTIFNQGLSLNKFEKERMESCTALCEEKNLTYNEGTPYQWCWCNDCNGTCIVKFKGENERILWNRVLEKSMTDEEKQRLEELQKEVRK